MKIITLDNQSWISIGKLSIPDITFSSILEEVQKDLVQKELEFYGKKVAMPRLTAWYGSKEYRYSGTLNKPKPMPEKIQQIAKFLEKEITPNVFNSVLCNYYRNGNDSVDWHADNEPELGPNRNNVLIGSVSLGQTRRFLLKNLHSKEKLTLDLEDKDVLIMGGETQKFWVHKVPKTTKSIGPRLNLTYRIIV